MDDLLINDKGAAIEATDWGDGRTALSWAAENGHEAVVRLLVDKRATSTRWIGTWFVSSLA
jgi:ankyrin repeat protein